MPAHLHPQPQCFSTPGNPCNPPSHNCAHRACAQGGRLLACESRSSNRYYCFHAEYYLGDDTVPDQSHSQRINPTKPTGVTPASTGDPIEDLIRAFESRPGNGVFPRVSRAEVAKGLRERVKDPSVINQGHTYMCGPAAFMYNFASDRPLDYVKFVTKLYDDGNALIRPSPDVIVPSRAFCGDSPAPGMPAVDWITLGSLRDSTNWIFDYRYNSSAEHLRGGTTEHDVIRWFRTAGYLNVQNWTAGHGQGMNARLANQYFADGYKVCLSIDADMLGGRDDADSVSIFPNHFVILTSPIRISDDGVTFTVYTWRDKSWQVPTRVPGQLAGKMPLNTFLSKYYGFIAAKP